MQAINTRNKLGQFDVMAKTRALQVAMMTLRGDACSDDEPNNEHPRSEQWLFVLAGRGTAIVIPRGGRRRTLKLKAGDLLLIEHGELHQIKNSGRGSLRTINFYAPPAYKPDGSVRPAARR